MYMAATTQLDLGKAAVSGIGLLLVGMMSWLINTTNDLDKQSQLQTYKLEEVEKQIHAIQLTDPSHDPAKCSVCLHIRMMKVDQ
jgi:hypothetical protein